MLQLRKRLRIFFKNLVFHAFHGSGWRPIRGWKVQSRGVHRDFCGSVRDSLTSGTSSHEKHLEIFSEVFISSVLVAGLGYLYATWFSRENHVFCILRVIFKVVFKHFSFFPYASLSLFIPSSLALFSHWPLCLFMSKRGRVYYFLCTFVGGKIHYTCPFITCYTLRV